jgi:hypothetical protein
MEPAGDQARELTATGFAGPTGASEDGGKRLLPLAESVWNSGMVNLPSWGYLALIAFGGFLVVAGNAGFPIAREQEKKGRLSADAWSIIRPELEDNRKIALDTLTYLDNNQVNLVKLRSSSWEVVSKGGMLLSLNSRDSLNLMRIYDKVYQINDMNAEYTDYGIGMKAVLSNRSTVMPTLVTNLKSRLKELQQDIDAVGKP